MRTAPISDLPEVGGIECPSRLQPTWALMLRGASQRASAVEAPALAMLLARGRRCAAHFDQTKPSGAYACLVRAKPQPAAVRNDRPLSFIVSGLLFTMTFATRTCRPHRALKILQGRHSRRRGRGAAVTFEMVVHPSRAVLRRRAALRWCAHCAAKGTTPAGFKGLLHPTAVCSSIHNLRILVTKV